MKNQLVYLFAILVFTTTKTQAQPCLPNGITFTTQSQIDSFPINFPNCTEIEGFVDITGGISSLIGLQQVSYIGSDLKIIGNNTFPFYLETLSGLDSLLHVGGDLKIQFNYGLTSLNGLNNLTTVEGSILIIDNFELQSLHGLENLSSVEDDFAIGGTEEMTTTEGLENLLSVNGDLDIRFNNALISLSGIGCIEFSSTSQITITNCPLLSECDVESICEHLGNGGAGDFSSNASGCNSISQLGIACIDPIQVSCYTSIENLQSSFFKNVEVYPNPTKDIFKIDGFNNAYVEVIVKDQLGNHYFKRLIKKQENINIANLPKGLYIVILTSNNFKIVKRIIKI